MPGTGLRILIADDNRDAAESMGMLMGIEGHTVYVAYDGEEAVDLALQVLPHVAILDIGMPRLDGNAAACHMRSRLPDHPMLIVSVSGRSATDAQRSSAPWFDHQFTKPVDLGVLLACINRWDPHPVIAEE